MIERDVSRSSSVSTRSGPGTSSSRSTSSVSNRFLGLPIAPRPLSATSAIGRKYSANRLIDAQADKVGLQLFRAGKGGAQMVGQGAVARHADRLLLALKGVFGHQAVLGLAEDEADGGLVVGVPEEVVDGGEVEAHLAGVLGLEVRHLELDDDVAAQAEVVEEEVEEEVPAAHGQRILGADEGEAGAQLEEEATDLLDQPPVEVALLGLVAEVEEVENVGVFEGRAGEVGLRRGEDAVEVVEGLPLPAVEAGLDLVQEDGPRPAVLSGLLRVPEAVLPPLQPLDQKDVMPPGKGRERGGRLGQVQFSHRLCENWG